MNDFDPDTYSPAGIAIATLLFVLVVLICLFPIFFMEAM